MQPLTQAQRAGHLVDESARRINDELTILRNGLGHQLFLTADVLLLRESVERCADLVWDLLEQADEMKRP